MIRSITPEHACACHRAPARRLGDAASDVASYQPGGSNYTPPLPEDTISPIQLQTMAQIYASWPTDTPATAAATTPPPKTSTTNWPLIAAVSAGTLLLISTIGQPGGRRR
jgi:hypothetical protein